MKDFEGILKFIILLFCFMVLFNILEYGFKWDDLWNVLYPSTLALIATINIFKPKLRRSSFILSYLLLGLMIATYLIGRLNLANALGSSGLAILIITLLTYLPQLIKEGYLKKI